MPPLAPWSAPERSPSRCHSALLLALRAPMTLDRRHHIRTTRQQLDELLCRWGIHKFRVLPGTEDGLAHDEQCCRCGAVATFTYPGV